MNDIELLPYRVGGLLYVPATNTNLPQKIKNRAYEKLRSVCYCLEDSIREDALESAEKTLKESLTDILDHLYGKTDLPMFFVRVRSPEHLEKIHNYLGTVESVLTGYIFPKFDRRNASAYIERIEKFQAGRSSPLYFMPILESKEIFDLKSRTEALYGVKEILDERKDLVLNVRVGGNDFCNFLGIRRNVQQSIYEIGVVRNILTDIANVFSLDYVVSGPVWEYFGLPTEETWIKGLQKETELDGLNGFIGKTCIHPSQLPIIEECLKVKKTDFEDAMQIINWSTGSLGVNKSVSGLPRMNELKCHANWANKIIIRSKVYGVKE